MSTLADLIEALERDYDAGLFKPQASPRRYARHRLDPTHEAGEPAMQSREWPSRIRTMSSPRCHDERHHSNR